MAAIEFIVIFIPVWLALRALSRRWMVRHSVTEGEYLESLAIERAHELLDR